MNAQWLIALLIAQLCVTWLMIGLIWFVQIVHYPLFRDVGEGNFRHYESRHTQRTGYVVALPMLLELAIAVFLAWKVGGLHAWAGLAILLLIWLATAIWQIPQHSTLSKGYDQKVWRALVRTNWLRTAGWSARGIISALWLLE